MRYTDRMLHPGEEVLFRARLHPLIFLKPLAVIVLLATIAGTVPPEFQPYAGAVLLAFGLPYTIAVTLSYVFGDVAVTRQRVLARTGPLRGQQHEVLLHKITETSSQGTALHMQIAGGVTRSVPFVRDVAALREAIGQARERLLADT